MSSTAGLQAYDVLSVPERKGIYDLYGTQGLTKGVFTKSGEKKGGDYNFHPKAGPPAVFEAFFGTNNPYQALNDISAAFEGLTTVPQPSEGKRRVREIQASCQCQLCTCTDPLDCKPRVVPRPRGGRTWVLCHSTAPQCGP